MKTVSLDTSPQKYNESHVMSPILMDIGLAYLLIPNIFFLVGWFEPWIAIFVSTLLLASTLCVMHSIHSSCSIRESATKVDRKASSYLFILLSGLIVLLKLASGGIIGIWPTYGDYIVLRESMMCNLRDAEWPLVLPNGREMTYYIANLLPMAAIGRLCSKSMYQWLILLWMFFPIFIALILCAKTISKGKGNIALHLLILTALIYIVTNPFDLIPRIQQLLLVYSQKLYHVLDVVNVDNYTSGIPAYAYLNPLFAAIGQNNSVPGALLATAMLMHAKGTCKQSICVMVMVLLAAASPLSCIGLMPIAACLFVDSIKSDGLQKNAIPPLLSGVVLFFPLAIYFLRAQGFNVVSLTPFIWYKRALLVIVTEFAVGWLLFVLPLWKHARQSVLFRACAISILFMPIVYIGSRPLIPIVPGINELSQKSIPCYLLILACFWVMNGSKIHKGISYTLLAMFMLTAYVETKNIICRASLSRYMCIDDLWNGHLNHKAIFLNQSIPKSSEPFLPNVILRKSGESSKHFPGMLLPKAPGCDYTQPHRGNEFPHFTSFTLDDD